MCEEPTIRRRRDRRPSAFVPVLAIAALLIAVAAVDLGADDRSTELLRYRCESQLTRRDVTLFANGTIRLREWVTAGNSLVLEEVDPDDEDDARGDQELTTYVFPDPVAIDRLPRSGSFRSGVSGGPPQGQVPDYLGGDFGDPLRPASPAVVGSQGGPRMLLEELGPDEIVFFSDRLLAILQELSRDQVRQQTAEGISGPSSEVCKILVTLPEERPFHYTFSDHDLVPPLVLRLVGEADHLATLARPLDRPQQLPAGYEPSFGDILITQEGQRFKVLRLTTDKRGVELQGLDQPVQIFIGLDDLAASFAQVERDSAPFWR